MTTMSRDILVDLIDRDPAQPRGHFDPAALQELADSLTANGQIVPITVRPVGERFVIVQGERRWRAAQLAGLATLRAEVVEIGGDEAYWLALVENVQRADLSPIEEARAFQRLIDQGVTQSALGKRIGKSQSYVAQKLRLLRMPEPLQVWLEHNVLTEGHMRQILRLQGIYGDDLTSEIDEHIADGWAKGDATAGGDFDERVAVGTFTVLFRPLDLVWGVAHPDLAQIAPYRDAIVAYGRYCQAHNYRPPTWVGKALWFAMTAAVQEASVVDLNQIIGLFEDILYSDVVMMDIYAKAKDQGERDKLLYWSAASDLRHAGLPATKDEQSHDLWLRAIKFVCTQRNYAYALPSQFQPGGHHADLGQTITQEPQEDVGEHVT